MTYFDELCRAMQLLAENEKTLFIGQAVAVAGTSLAPTLDGINLGKRIEFPVAEELQIGTCIGLALQGFLPICVYPRWNFMLRAADGIVNHLDRLPLYSDGGYCPKVIIRTAAPSTFPLNPGPQHDDNFTSAFGIMLRTVRIIELRDAESIVPCYMEAMASEKSTILVEFTEHYKNQRGGEK